MARKFIEEGNLNTNLTAYIHNNDKYPMHKNIVCVDRYRNNYLCRSKGKWIIITDFNDIRNIIYDQHMYAKLKLIGPYLESEKATVSKEEYDKLCHKLHEQIPTLCTLNESYQNDVINGLPDHMP
jgi:hypothetical protein